MLNSQFTRWICTASLLLSLYACDSNTVQVSGESSSTDSLPRAITDLRSLALGEITFRVVINGAIISDSFSVTGNSSNVSLNAAQLSVGDNSVSVTFYFESPEVDRRPFVSGTQVFNYDGSSTSLLLSGLNYDYADTDNDGIFDVHELAIEPVDIDLDGQLNPDDEDSDDDGLIDGEDLTPWGPGSTPDAGALLSEIDVQASDGSIQTLLIDQIIGGSGETARLANLTQPLQLQIPSTWPATAQIDSVESHRWTAFEWRVENRGICNDFRIPLDVTSLQLNSSTGVILYFQRYTGPPFLTTLASAELSDLDIYNHTPPLDGDGPLNDALRIVFVPDYHTGWIDVWTQSEFTGEYCSVNLTTPATQ